MKRFALIVLILVAAQYFAFPVNSSINFKHVTTADGLSQSTAFCIIQDSRGFLWVGTQDGLNKYDGYTFTVYKPDPDDSNTLSDTQIFCIMEDRLNPGIFWIGTISGGLNKFDSRIERFYRYSIDPNNPNAVGDGSITSFCQDKSGALWVGTGRQGVYKIVGKTNPDGTQTERIFHYTSDPNDPFSLCNNGINMVYGDRSGNIWVSTGAGLNKYNAAKDNFSRYTSDPTNPRSLSGNFISDVYEDSAGMFWVGTIGGGLNLMNKDTGDSIAYRFDPNNPASISSDFINVIYEDDSGIIWIGTINAGLNRFNKRTESFVSYLNNPSDPKSLSINNVISIFEDNSNVLWIGTGGGGLNKFDREEKFNLYKSSPQNPNGLSNSFVYSVYEDRGGMLWIGTLNGGLNQLDRRTGIVKHFRNDINDPSSLGSDVVRGILEDHSGVLWVGTMGGGAQTLNRETWKFKSYLRNPDDPHSLSSNVVRTIYEDKQGTVWIGTMGSGLNRYNRAADNFTVYRNNPDDPNSLSDNGISSICDSSAEPGILWVGTLNNGVNRFDLKNETFTRYIPSLSVPGSLSKNVIQCVYEDTSGTLWVGTFGGGLNKLVRSKDGNHRFVHYTERHGMPSNSIYGILEDDTGCLWISTNKGVSCLNPKTESFKNYSILDGLQADEFNGGSYFKSKRGELFFGGIDGLNCFFPSQFKANPHIPPIVINGFTLFNKSVPIAPKSLLPRSITWMDRLVLTYRHNVISFEFSALDFTVPGKNRYMYKMEGFNETWIATDARKRFASYTNLSPGKYLFRVKGSNNDGIWSEKGASIVLVITPPFWKTWWFQLLAVLAVLAFVWFWYRKRLKTVRLKAEMKTAHDAQMSIMPQSDPIVPGLDVSGVCVPSCEVGGDFFDYIWMNDDKTIFGIAIGDVSGKAMKSAMTAVMTSGMIYMEADESNSVKEIMERVNRPLYLKTQRKIFTALCLAAFDLEKHTITFTNAGLYPPLLKSGNQLSRLEGKGRKLPLGIRINTQYSEQTYPLKPGDVIIFFTDGVTESKNPSGDFYGLGRLKEFLAKTDFDPLTAEQIKTGILSDIKNFSHDTAPYDDMTVIVVKIVN